MKRGISIIRFAVFVCFLTGASILVNGQDLGSTSGLFRSKSTKKSAPPSKKSTKKAVKKSSPKKRTVKRRSTTKKSSRSRRAVKRASSKKASSKRSNAGSSKTSVPKTALTGNDDIVITVSKPTSENVAEMFENAIAEGNEARNRRSYDVSEKAYKEARKLNPADSRALYGLGNIYSDQQRWEVAEAAYRSALKLDPGNPMVHIALSYVLTQPAVGTKIGERYLEADELAQKAIKMDPENPLAYDQLGIARELRGIIDGVTESNYRKAISLDPSFALAYGHMGRLLRKQGRTAESSAAYNESIRLATNVPAMILVAEVMQTQQRYLDSEQLLREALRRDQRNPTGLYLLGRALTTRKSFEEAENVLKQSVSVSPHSFVSYALLGSLYSQSGDYAKAEQTLVKASTVISENEKKRLAQEFELVGDGLLKQNRNNEAARLFRRAIALDGEREILSSKLEAALAY